MIIPPSSLELVVRPCLGIVFVKEGDKCMDWFGNGFISPSQWEGPLGATRKAAKRSRSKSNLMF